MQRIAAPTALFVLSALAVTACQDPVRPRYAPSRPRLNLGGPSATTTMSITVTDLGTLGADNTGLEQSRAYAINDSGVVTGGSTKTGSTERQVFRWTALTGLQSVGIPGDGLDINGKGTIVGRQYVNGYFEGFARLGPAALAKVGVTGVSPTEATGINDAGYVVGTTDNGFVSFLWNPITHGETLFDDDPIWTAAAINSSKQIVGVASHAFLDVSRDGYRRTPLLGGPVYEYIQFPNDRRPHPTDIDDAGRVVGWTGDDPFDPTTAEAWQWTSQASTVQLLASGGRGAAAFGTNKAGYVVGAGSDVSAPVFWTPAGAEVHLPRLTPGRVPGCPALAPADVACRADDINTKLQIVGADVAPNGDLHAVLWTLKFTTTVTSSIGPRPVSLQSTGTLALTIYGAPTFDVRSIDAGALTLGTGNGPGTRVALRRGRPFASLEDADGDGQLDLIVHFFISDLVQHEDLTPWTTQLTLTGDFGDGTILHSVADVQIASTPVRGR